MTPNVHRIDTEQTHTTPRTPSFTPGSRPARPNIEVGWGTCSKMVVQNVTTLGRPPRDSQDLASRTEVIRWFRRGLRSVVIASDHRWYPMSRRISSRIILGTCLTCSTPARTCVTVCRSARIEQRWLDHGHPFQESQCGIPVASAPCHTQPTNAARAR